MCVTRIPLKTLSSRRGNADCDMGPHSVKQRHPLYVQVIDRLNASLERVTFAAHEKAISHF